MDSIALSSTLDAVGASHCLLVGHFGLPLTSLCMNPGRTMYYVLNKWRNQWLWANWEALQSALLFSFAADDSAVGHEPEET